MNNACTLKMVRYPLADSEVRNDDFNLDGLISAMGSSATPQVSSNTDPLHSNLSYIFNKKKSITRMYNMYIYCIIS